MLSDNQRQERNRAGVRRWYHENRDEYNKIRRQRYAANIEERERARQRAARYREEKPTIERKLFREVNGRRVQVFSTGQVAEMLGRTPQMLRNWERAAMIPPTSFEGKHRLYTKRQVTLLLKLAEVIKEYGGGWSHPKVKAKVRHIHKRW
jgi:DNA-binding transcriptional regulator YiaG